MTQTLGTILIGSDSDLVSLRSQARSLCAYLEVAPVHALRFATAVHELANQNFTEFGKLTAHFHLAPARPLLLCTLRQHSDARPWSWTQERLESDPLAQRVASLASRLRVEDEAGSPVNALASADRPVLVVGRKLPAGSRAYAKLRSTPPAGSQSLAEVDAALRRTRRSEARLKATARTLDLAIELAEIAIVELDIGADTCNCNELAEELLGLDGDYDATDLRSALANIPSALLRSLFDPSFCGTASEVIEWIPDTKWVSAKLETPSTETPSDRLLVMLDVTERVRRERELDERVQLEQQLVGIVSHDLKSPLGTVSLTLEVLESTAEEEQKRPIELGKRAVARAERMIFDLLDYTRDRLSDSMPITLRQAHLETIVKPLVDAAQLERVGRVVLACEGDLAGVWDAGRLSQLASNLIENALAYSPEESSITVTLSGNGDSEVSLSVHNDGPPIRDDFRERMFRPFERDSLAKRDDSLGLGMYIVKLVVDAHDGSIDVHSTREDGTTITVTLPRDAS